MKNLVFFLVSLLIQTVFGAAPPIPVKAIYIDYKNIDYNNGAKTLLEAVDAGYNMIIISFYLSTSGAADYALVWSQVPAQTQIDTMAAVHAKGAYALVSFGGGTDAPYDKDPTALGTEIGNWCVQNHLDGIDFDLENFAAGLVASPKNSQQSIDWVVKISQAARAVIGSNRFITHAPQGPYFGPIGATNTWAGPLGGYTGVYQAYSDIDLFFVQFYNQGAQCYTDYAGAFATSCTGTFPLTSVMEIANAGVPLSKIVFGKPVAQSDAGNGYVDPATLNTWLVQARNQYGFKTGVFGWVWADTASLKSWVNTIFNGIPQESSGSLTGTPGDTATQGGLSTGAAAAIAVVVIVVVIAAVVVVLIVLIKKEVIDTYPLRRRVRRIWGGISSKIPSRPGSQSPGGPVTSVPMGRA